MPTRWSTWAIAIWTAFMGVAIVAAALGIGQDCVGLSGSELSSCQTDAWLRGAVGLGLLALLWFIVFVPLRLISRQKRPGQVART